MTANVKALQEYYSAVSYTTTTTQLHTAESVGNDSFQGFPLYSAPPFHLNALIHPPFARSAEQNKLQHLLLSSLIDRNKLELHIHLCQNGLQNFLRCSRFGFGPQITLWIT